MRALALLLMLAWPAAAETVAFAKYGPLPGRSAPAGGAATPLPVEPGTAYPVAAQEPGFVAIDHPSGRIWLRDSDVFLTDRPRRIAAGPGFRVADRQRLRFWAAHGRLADFLSRGDALGSPADFEEIPRPGATLALPALAFDRVDLRGRRGVTVAAVLVPVASAQHAAFERLRGVAGADLDLHLVVDASADARGFTGPGVPALLAELQGRLRGGPNRTRVTLHWFGAGLTVPDPHTGTLADPPPDPPAAVPSDDPLPALAALHAARARLAEGAAGGAVVLWSGPDLAASERVDGQTVTPARPALALPPQVGLVLAEATPEPGEALAALADALPDGAARLVPFADNQPAALARAIAELLARRPAEPLAAADLARTCDGLAGTLCLVPLAATRATPLPAPPDGAADWYGVVLWVVVDGLILAE